MKPKENARRMKDWLGRSVVLLRDCRTHTARFRKGERLIVLSHWRGRLTLAPYRGSGVRLRHVSRAYVKLWSPQVGRRYRFLGDYTTRPPTFCTVITLNTRPPDGHKAEFEDGTEITVYDQELAEVDG